MARRANGEGTIYREKSTGRWVGAITVEGRRRKVKAGTRDEARRRLDEVKRTAHDGRSVGDGNMTVNQLIALYDEKALTTRGRSIGTIDGHRWALKVAAAAIGTKRLRTLTVEDVEGALSARDLSRSSAVKERRTAPRRSSSANGADSSLTMWRASPSSPPRPRRRRKAAP